VEATKKSKEIDNLLTNIIGKDRQKTVVRGGCMTCNNTCLSFRDQLSEREYKISGMCQSCQDDTFGV